MAIAILPYEVRLKGSLADLQLDQLRWPLQEPPVNGTVGDLTVDDHLIVYPRSRNFWDPRVGTKCRVSLIMPEPYVIHRRNYRLAVALQARFHRIITHRPAMQKRTTKALLMPFGGAWVDPDIAASTSKTRFMSLIASKKRDQPGHILRHELADWCAKEQPEVDLLGLAYEPIDRKEDGLASYHYSIIIENCQETGYFTEKLVDCLLCNTVPIYWGAPDIAEYFEPEGMMICNSVEEMREAIAKANPDDYKRRRKSMERNREKALQYQDYELNAARNLLREAG